VRDEPQTFHFNVGWMCVLDVVVLG
jgi:hypothetical protein